MKQVDEKVKMSDFIEMSVDDMGELVLVYNDMDEIFELNLDARKVFYHLKEFFEGDEYDEDAIYA